MSSKRTKRSPSDVGKRLKRVRESGGIDDEQLSAVAGLARTHVFMIEVGWITSPKVETVLPLAKALGAKLDYLLAGQGKPPTPDEVRRAFSRAERSAG